MEGSVEEDKIKDFIRLVDPRMKKALESLRKLGNLADRKRYSYTDQLVKEKIFDVLENEIEELKRKFKGKRVSIFQDRNE